MNSLVQVIITKLSSGKEYPGLAWCVDGQYEAIWNEGGLRCVFHFNDDGSQIGSNRYKMRRALTVEL
jgi:hypothetical protein